MSINEMDSKIKELRELRRMADELAGDIESITDSIKAYMDMALIEALEKPSAPPPTKARRREP